MERILYLQNQKHQKKPEKRKTQTKFDEKDRKLVLNKIVAANGSKEILILIYIRMNLHKLSKHLKKKHFF